jgi:very-short-patch-repair endonuclease
MPRQRPDAYDVVRRAGGVARLNQILRESSRHSLRRAVISGDLRRVGRGTYALPESKLAYQAAGTTHGLVSHTSAAAHWLLGELQADPIAHVTVRRHGRSHFIRGVKVHHSDVAPADDHGGVTSPLRTVLDCAAILPFADALAIADSALRNGLVDAGIRSFEPQLQIQAQAQASSIYVDLGDSELQIALEADSFSFHGGREALLRDCRRYNDLVRHGWLVLRFGWEHVMFERAWVATTVVETHARRQDERQKRRTFRP